MDPLLIAILTGVASGLVSWGTIRTEIRFLWRSHERLEQRVHDLERMRDRRLKGVPS